MRNGRGTDKVSSLFFIDESTADLEQSSVLEAAKQKVGFIPNMYRGMANVPFLLRWYLDGYESYRANSCLTPIEQEVIFLTVSRENECTYCMAAHSTVADNMSAVPTDITDAIRAGVELPDPKLNVLSQFTKTVFEDRGKVSAQDIETIVQAGFSQEVVLEVIFVIAVKTLSNYCNHIFAPELDPVFAKRKWD